MIWLAMALAAPQTQDAGVWTSLNLAAPLHDGRDAGPRLWLDMHGRRTDASFLAIIRPGVGVDLTRGVAVFAGYAWVPSIGSATDDTLAQEHRVWEQALLQRSVESVKFAFRPRLEQRFVTGEVGHRLRLWGRAEVPLSEAVSFVVTDEVFVGVNDTEWGAVAGFDQNRLFVGPALPIEGVGRVEFGYMNTLLHRDVDTDVHIVSATLFINL